MLKWITPQIFMRARKKLIMNDTDVSSAVYEATALIEKAEQSGIYRGNGHHARQIIARFAQLVFLAGCNQLSDSNRVAVYEIRSAIHDLNNVESNGR